MKKNLANDPDNCLEAKRAVFNHYLKLNGITIKTLAEKCGYQPSSIYNMLRNGYFSKNAAEIISKCLHCKIEELLEGRFIVKTQNVIHAEKNLKDYQIVEDERVFLRMMLLSQQRTIENLSQIARKKLKEEMSKYN